MNRGLLMSNLSYPGASVFKGAHMSDLPVSLNVPHKAITV